MGLRKKLKKRIYLRDSNEGRIKIMLKLGIMMVFLISMFGCSNSNESDEKQYNDFLSEFRNWEEKLDKCDNLITEYDVGRGPSIDRISDVSYRQQTNYNISHAQGMILMQIFDVQHTFFMYSNAWAMYRITGKEQEEQEDKLSSRQEAYLDSKSELNKMISNYVSKRWDLFKD